MKEYIYILDYKNIGFDKAIKIGSTRFPISRLSTYQTGLPFNISYSKLYQVDSDNYNCYQIDDLINITYQKETWKYKNNEGGDEWYDSTVINNKVIEKFFNQNKINFQLVNLEDCERTEQFSNYKKELINKEEINWKKNTSKKMVKPYKFKLHIEPYDYQRVVLNNLERFKRIKKGKLIWSCGMGKTYMSLFICHELNARKILICVPSIYLLNQFRLSVKKVFNYNPFCVYSCGIKKKKIKKYLHNKEHLIILSTYHSCKKILTVSKSINYNFDIKIGDESHHLVTSIKEQDKSTFDKFHSIKSTYSLFMTATEKNYESEINNRFFTMSDVNDFGILIDNKSIKWAIENKKITDYRLVCYNNSNKDLDGIKKSIKLDLITNSKLKLDKNELFLAAFSAVKSISDGISKHILVYVNSCEAANIVKQIIKLLLDHNLFDINKKELYNNDLHSNNGLNIFNENENEDSEITKFKNSKYGIISCVYIFGEGFDLPNLDSVVIGESMQSEIRIVQSCLRANRLDKNDIDKIGKIIIPTNINSIDNKLKSVITNLRMVDDSIEQKIDLYNINSSSSKNGNLNKISVKLEKDNYNLNKLKLELFKSGCFDSELSLSKEFELYYKLVLSYKFKSVKEYLNSELKYKNPEIYFNGLWKNWFEFLGIDTSKWINNKQSWIEYCKRKNIKNAEDYYLKLDSNMPPEPQYFYSNFTNFENELDNYNNNYLFI